MRCFKAVVAMDGYSLLWLLAARTGMGQGELLGLRWQHVDLDRDVLRVVQAVPTVHTGVEFAPPKSGRGRTIKLSPATIAVLKQHRAADRATTGLGRLMARL